jgi:hypothetical protein
MKRSSSSGLDKSVHFEEVSVAWLLRAIEGTLECWCDRWEAIGFRKPDCCDKKSINKQSDMACVPSRRLDRQKLMKVELNFG